MKNTQLTPDDIVTRGTEIYQDKLRLVLEPDHNGQVVVINVHTGEFEVDKRHLSALNRARARWPDEIFYAARVGAPALGHIDVRLGLSNCPCLLYSPMSGAT